MATYRFKENANLENIKAVK